jgi:predicted dehydrogenase
MIKMGVLGVGHLGRRHAQAILEIDGVSLEGIYDIRSDVAKEIGQELDCRVYEDGESLLENVDAVSIVVPTNQHYQVACRALDAGVHMLVEKPITNDVEEAGEIIRLSKSKNLVLQVGHVERFNPAFCLSGKYIENPLFIESHRLSPFVPRGIEVDVVLDLMIHDIDLTLLMMNSDAEEAWAVGVPVVTPSVDIANTRLSFSGQRAASLTASRISKKRMRKVRIFQRDTYISMDLLKRKSEMYHIRWKDGEPILKERVFETSEPVNPLANEISSFVQSIREGVPPRVTGEDAKRALEHALKIRDAMFVPPFEVERLEEG